ncbi:MAG: hypothetical protein JST98_01015 [Bacteroidetes bacterium]|nr:hypothetical protein [Bacteroidota bacterium]MBS1943794.1 hypothetical protein [Bacteroidota bacterium]
MRCASAPFLAAALALLLAAGQTRAQVAPSMGAFQFSTGVHPTFDAAFEDASTREVERFWQNELKAISMKVSGRKELTGHAARIPAASPDTLQVLLAVEKPKGGLYTTAHIAFLTTSGYVSPDSREREVAACTEWVRQRMVTLQRQLAQAALDRGQRQLDDNNRQLDQLKREGQRAQDNLRRSQQRIEQAVLDSAEAARQLRQLSAPDSASQADSATAALRNKQVRKEQATWQDRAKRAAYAKQGLEKRVKDLQWAIRKNGEDQAGKQAAIERQQAVVKQLQEKLQAIH